MNGRNNANKKESTIVIRVEIPALTELVAYLRGDEQAMIDAMSQKLQQAGITLDQSETDLKTVLDNQLFFLFFSP